MDMTSYDYSQLAQHPKLLALYGGWVGQKICALVHSAVTWDRSDDWRGAAAEVDRLVFVLNAAEKAKLMKSATGPRSVLGTLVEHCADGGWWSSEQGIRERSAGHDGEINVEQASESHAGGSASPLFPQLVLQDGALYAVAGEVLGVLGHTVRGIAAELASLDLCRLGVLLAGFCYRLTSRLHVRLINSVLDDLAGRDMVDLQAENELRRTLSLVEVGADRRPVSLSEPKPYPAPMPEDVHRGGQGEGAADPFNPNINVTIEHRVLILACVFRRFDLPVPPAESDASGHPELAGLKKELRTVSGKITKQLPPGTQNERKGKDAGGTRDHLWIDEAITYLGADQLPVNPRKFMYRLVGKGALPDNKINGRFVFFKVDLDRVIANGDHKRKRGRPRKRPSE